MAGLSVFTACRTYAADANSPVPTPQELEAAGAHIGTIRIVPIDVFDLENPADNKPLFRLANRLHISTRPEVIRQQLLFKEGDTYSERLALETARILRAKSYLYEASVTPVAYADGVVDLEVRTQDVWTFNPGLSFDRAGGENSYSFKLEESNVLGFGKEITVERESGVDRSSTNFTYLDQQLLGTWNRLRIGYSRNSDGDQSEFNLDRPFYSVDTRRAAGFGFLDWSRTDARYDLGEIVDEFRHEEQTYGLHYGWSQGLRDGWVRRWTFGLAYEEDRFAPSLTLPSTLQLPADRTLAYPQVGFQLFQDQYEVRRNENQIARTEDVYTGMFLAGTLGLSSSIFGGDDALIFAVSAGRSYEFDEREHTILLASSAGTRIESGDFKNAEFSLDAQYYWRMSQRRLFFASITGTVTKELDPERQLLLGGDAAGLTSSSPTDPSALASFFSGSETSLRGYPLRYQDGSAFALLTLEHRFYSDYYLFRLFHVGGAVFTDVGRTWGRGTAGGTSQGWLADAGFGLRLGSSRSAFGNVIHLDVAFPFNGDDTIDDVQFLVETKRSF